MSGDRAETDGGDGADEACRRGLKMSTMIRPKMISRSRSMHALRPVFFWYLWRGEAKRNAVSSFSPHACRKPLMYDRRTSSPCPVP